MTLKEAVEIARKNGHTLAEIRRMGKGLAAIDCRKRNCGARIIVDGKIIAGSALSLVCKDYRI